MPTNFRIISNVILKTQKEFDVHTSASGKGWSAHLPEGCGREVIRVLDKLANNNPDRWVFISIPGLVKACNGRQRKSGSGGYSETAVRQWFKFLQDEGIVSCRYKTGPGGRQQQGFVIAAHDAYCRRYPKSCNYKAKKAVLEPGPGEEFGLVAEPGDGAGKDAVFGGCDQGVPWVSSGCATGTARVSSGCGNQGSEVAETPAVNEERANTNLLNRFKPFEPEEPGEPQQPRQPHKMAKRVEVDVVYQPSLSPGTPTPSPVAEQGFGAGPRVCRRENLPWWVDASWKDKHGQIPNLAPKHVEQFLEILDNLNGDREAQLEMSWWEFARLENPPYCLDPDKPDYTRYPVRIFLQSPFAWWDKDNFKGRLLGVKHERDLDFARRWWRWLHGTALQKPVPKFPGDA